MRVVILLVMPWLDRIGLPRMAPTVLSGVVIDGGVDAVTVAGVLGWTCSGEVVWLAAMKDLSWV